MAEERTEQATPRRRQDARRRGEVARSPELAGAAVLIGALLGLKLGWRAMLQAATELLQTCLQAIALPVLTLQSTGDLARLALMRAVAMLLPVALLACVAAGAANLAQGGFLVSGHPLLPKWSRISFSQGIKRILSTRGCFALLRCLVKLAAVFLVTLCYLRSRAESLLGLAHGTPASAGAGVGSLLYGLLVRVAGVMLAVAIADYLFQRREHERNLRMTRHELKEEHKQSEGDPLLRARLREQQRALARHRMLEAVKKATAVVVNPIQIAVAIRYDTPKMPAPVVVAKGRRLIAARIREQARKHGVPIIPDPELARALYRSVPLGRQIPPELYQAVAEIIAFIYRLSGRRPR